MKTKEIAAFLEAEIEGDGDVEISEIAAIDVAGHVAISFFSSTAEFTSSAAAVIVPADYELPNASTLIKVTDPKLAFVRISEKILPRESRSGWHESAALDVGSSVRAAHIGAFASIGAGSDVGEGSEIHAGVQIGRNVRVGNHTIIYPNCVIYDGASIGNKCVIHAGTVIGSDGFGYAKDKTGEHHQFPQVGHTVIGDRVEIGANCTIDRGSLGTTQIGSGTKVDNMVHIAHNVQIGKRVIIAGQSGIAGSSVIEDDVVIAGQVGISDHVTIKTGAVIGAKSAVFPNKIVRAGVWMGIPVQPIERYMQKSLQTRNLDQLVRDVSELKKLL